MNIETEFPNYAEYAGQNIRSNTMYYVKLHSTQSKFKNVDFLCNYKYVCWFYNIKLFIIILQIAFTHNEAIEICTFLSVISVTFIYHIYIYI